MKNIFLVIVFSILCSNNTHGQIGITASYNTNDYADWNDFFSQNSTENVLNSGFEVGIDYWFRLKNKRIEFFPGISFALDNKSSFSNYEINLNAINLNFPTHFYILDMAEDCNCPTFSKSGPGFEKGFFVHLSPGLSYVTSKLDDLVNEAKSNNNLTFRVGVGFGLDIGINDFITVSPIYSYIYNATRNLSIEYPDNPNANLNLESTGNQHQFGLRLGLRFDYNNGRRR